MMSCPLASNDYMTQGQSLSCRRSFWRTAGSRAKIKQSILYSGFSNPNSQIGNSKGQTMSLSAAQNTLMYPSSKRLAGDNITGLAEDELPPLTSLDCIAQEGECRWPSDKITDGVMWCCGRQCHLHSPYCPDHHKRAYVKPKHFTARSTEIQHERGVIQTRKNGFKKATSETLKILSIAEDIGL